MFLFHEPVRQQMAETRELLFWRLDQRQPGDGMVDEVHVRVFRHPIKLIARRRPSASVAKDVPHRPYSMPYPSYTSPKPMDRAAVPK